jgi:large subunit ribosomal protein L25
VRLFWTYKVQSLSLLHVKGSFPMKLSISKRTHVRKSDTLNVRREGNVPAILYSVGEEPSEVVILGAELQAVLRQVKQGRLSTTIFELGHEGKVVKALVKDIQYHPTTYNVIHVDFQQLNEQSKVRVKVPIEFIGAAESAGVKLGGFLRPIIRYVNVECLPKDIPSYFELSVAELGMRQSKRIQDLSFPNGVRPLTKVDEVAVVIAKR